MKVSGYFQVPGSLLSETAPLLLNEYEAWDS